MRDHGGSIVNIIADVRNGFPGFAYVFMCREILIVSTIYLKFQEVVY